MRGALVWFALALAACGGSSVLAPRSPTEHPSEREDLRATLRTDTRFDAAARYAADHAGHALLILEGGEVVYEAGQNGHDADEPHAIDDASQSFWGVLAVAAASDGLIDLEETVAAVLPEFGDSEWKRRMRIRQLLHFTSGLETGLRPLPSGRDRIRALQMVSRPGERFQYGPSHLYVFEEVLRRKLTDLQQTPLGFLEERLFAAIDLEVDEWREDEDGEPDLASGAVLRAREWAKFGSLIANGGRWGGRSVVDAEALEQCVRGSAVEPGFGLAIWLNRAGGRRGGTGGRFYPAGLLDMVIAAGSPQQRLYILPSRDLVVVRFGANDRRWRDFEFVSRLMDSPEIAAGPGSR